MDYNQSSRPPMRILFVISGLGYGGAETQVIALARKLKERGHAMAIYTLHSDLPRLHELEGSNVEIVIDQKSKIIDFSVMYRLRHYILHFKPDIILGFLYDGCFYSRLACLGTPFQAISSERSDQYKMNRNQRIGHQLTYRLTKTVIANSHSGARFSQTLYRLPAKHVHVIWNGIDIERIQQRINTCSENYKKLFFNNTSIKLACLVGNIKPDKDYILALETAQQLIKADPSWHILFIGDQLSKTGEYKTKILQLYDSMNLHNQIKFTGTRRDVIEIMSQSDLLFSTSIREGFPNVVLEAMTIGIPVISTAYSDIQMILPQPWQVVSTRQSKDIVHAIHQAMQHAPQLISEQKNWVHQHATIDASARQAERVFQTIIKNQNTK
jgi:glycosyltransferase involved in cell wall biosynthesis